MAEIISCSKDTQLHSFPELEQLSSSAHVNSNGSDCQFFGSSKLFVRANKNSGIELLRLKDGDGPSTGSSTSTTRSIATVKKMMIDNLYCVACPKTASKDEIAIGLTSGTVRFMNYKKANFTKRFDPDRLAVSVTFMDFNATDDFLAAVYENGLVNVYGMKTSSKLHTLAFDKNTIKARFHPTKRFHMAVASYNGGVLLFDTQTKKTVFSQPSAHGAPCRDVAMVETYPDYLFSVGYDSVLNLYDTRRKDTASHIRSNYPFESLAIADDGQHLVVGNLKGYVYGYDLRNLQEPLIMKKIHESSVTSVTFVPQPREGSIRRSMIELEESRKMTRGVRISEGGGRPDLDPAKRLERMKLNDHHQQQQQPPPPPAPPHQQQHQNHEQHDSFIGDIDVFLHRREAPLDCLSRLSSSSRLSVESRSSMQMGGNNLMGFLEDLSDCNIETDLMSTHHAAQQQQLSGSVSDQEPSIDDSFVNVNRLLKRVKAEGGRANASAADRLHRKGVIDNLENIREEGSDIGEGGHEGTESEEGHRSSSGTKTSSSPNPNIVAGRVLAESQNDNKVKAPQQETRKSSSLDSETTSRAIDVEYGKEKGVRSSMVSFRQELYNASTPEPSPGLAPVGGTRMPEAHFNDRHFEQHSPTVQQLSSEVAELRKTMLDQFQLNMHQHLDAEQAMRSQLWMGMFNLWRETQRKLESLEQITSTGFGLLLPRDEFAKQFLSMRVENEMLRNRLKELEDKQGN